MKPYGDYDPNHVKHLEMIQAVIARLAGNSFLIKGWALTFTGVILGFAVNKDTAELAATAFAPIVVFWLLDAYYLRNERLFRELYSRVRKDDKVKPFEMSATGKEFRATAPVEARSLFRTAFRGTVVWLYTLLAIATILVMIVICTR